MTPLVKTASVLSKVIQEGTPSTLSVTEIASQSWTDRTPSARKESITASSPTLSLPNFLLRLLKTFRGNANPRVVKSPYRRNIFKARPRLRIYLPSLTTNTNLIMNNPFYILLAILAAAAMAAPAIIEQADAVAGRSTPTTCVTGSPVTTSGFDIDYQPLEAVASGNRFYDIDPSFKTDHSVGSAMVRIVIRPFLRPSPHIVPLNPHILQTC